MKKILLFALALTIVLSTLILTSGGEADAAQRVRGYYRRSGTYVFPHYRSYRNPTRWDNWSTRGNYNPYTGRRGYQSPYQFRY